MGTRIDLQNLLAEILGCPAEGSDSRVYYQPPTGTRIKYPCIIYKFSTADTKFADNRPYKRTRRYEVTLIDRNPDSVYEAKIAELPMCFTERNYTADNLYHFVFNIYY